ncbi:MAG: helix-turn-helix domain-containing protein [Hyphomicrobiaceae bacterium]
MASDATHDVRELNLLKGVNADTRHRLLNNSSFEIVPPDTIIVFEGDRPDHLYFVLDGVVELSASMSESRAVISLLYAGDCFILSAVVKDAVALMSARSLGKVEIASVPAPLFRKCMRRDAKLLHNVSVALGGGFRNMVRYLRDHKLRSADQRLAAYLVRLIGENGGACEITLPLRKHVIASFLGMKPESLSRAFAGLHALGVSVEGERVSVRDPIALERFANIDRALDDSDA